MSDTAPQVIQERTPVTVSTDKLDEMIAYGVAMRSSSAFNPQVPFAIVPSGMKVLDVEDNMPAPARVQRAVTFTDVTSFLQYFKDFRGGYLPRLFSTTSNAGMALMAIMDFDIPGSTAATDADTADTAAPGPTYMLPAPCWNSHKAFLKLQYHRDYAELRAISGKFFPQADFAEFVEENLHLFATPSAADMLEIAQHLKASINVGWQSGKRLSNGSQQLEYIETIEAVGVRGDLKVPEDLVLRTPLFEGSEAFDVPAKFRYRIGPDKKAQFSIKLLTKVVERDAEDAVKAQVTQGAELPIMAVTSFRGIGRYEHCHDLDGEGTPAGF